MQFDNIFSSIDNFLFQSPTALFVVVAFNLLFSSASHLCLSFTYFNNRSPYWHIGGSLIHLKKLHPHPHPDHSTNKVQNYTRGSLYIQLYDNQSTKIMT
jgi:hypothetical protein